MENVADALKMAAAVLIFVLALTISIYSFGQARATSQIILDYQDRENDSDFYTDNKDTKRIVGVETIIPSIYRAYKENYKIVFKFSEPNEYYLYKKKGSDGKDINIYTIDLEKEKDVIGNKEQFILAILYGKSGLSKKGLEKDDIDFYQKTGITLQENGIYGTIKKMKFEESLGVYYQEELQEDQTNTPDANKTKKRVITYTQQ